MSSSEIWALGCFWLALVYITLLGLLGITMAMIRWMLA